MHEISRPILNTIAKLGRRLESCQRGVRVLAALAWNDAVREQFFADQARELPRVSPATYHDRPLGFDLDRRREELRALHAACARLVPRGLAARELLERSCDRARATLELLAARGTPRFPAIARSLYGQPTRTEQAVIEPWLELLIAQAPSLTDALGPRHTAEESRLILQRRLERALPGAHRFRILTSSKILAQAVVGGFTLKLRSAAHFSRADLSVLEAHEIWVHLGTSRNGGEQRRFPFLRQAGPACALAQEGLAVLTEIAAGVCHAARLAKILRRFQAAQYADAGADFLQIYRFFLEAGDPPAEAYQQSARIFRGSLPAGLGGCGKDRAYALGLFRVLAALDLAQPALAVRQIAAWVCGKTCLDDGLLVLALHAQGLLHDPVCVPEPFAPGASGWDRLRRLPHPGHPRRARPHFVEKAHLPPGKPV